MAKQLNVRLSVDADVKQAKAAFEQLQKTLTDIQSSAMTSSKNLFNVKEIKAASEAARELQQHLAAATDANTGRLNLSTFSNSLKTAGKDLSTYKLQLESLGPSGEKAFTQIAKSIAMADNPLRRTNGLLQEFRTTLVNTARWQISSSILHGFMGAVQSAYGYAQDLNESLNNIRIVTGLNTDQMAKFADEANKAAKALSTTTLHYTDAALIYYQQGLTGKDVTDRVNTTIKLANVSRQNAEEVSSQMTAIWNNFYDGSKSLEYYADVITALGAATASSSDEIAQGLQKFAAVADTVGLSYEKATAALATVVAETRQSADVVGTAFKTMFARFQGVTLGETLEDGVGLNKYSQALATVGVNILEANGNLKDMDTILDELGAKWNQIGNAQQVALAETVAGTRQYAQFMAIMENYDKILANQKLGAGAEGTLQKQANIYAESWEAASKRVKAALETIYDNLINDKFFIGVNNVIADLLDGVNGFIKGLGGVKGILSTVGALITQSLAKEAPVALSRINEFLTQISGKAQQIGASMQSQVQEWAAVEAKSASAEFQAFDTAGPNATEYMVEVNIIELLAEKKRQYNQYEAQYNSEQKKRAQDEIASLEAVGAALTKKGAALDSLRIKVDKMSDSLNHMAQDAEDGTKAFESIDRLKSVGKVSGQMDNLSQQLSVLNNQYKEGELAEAEYQGELEKIGTAATGASEELGENFGSTMRNVQQLFQEGKLDIDGYANWLQTGLSRGAKAANEEIKELTETLQTVHNLPSKSINDYVESARQMGEGSKTIVTDLDKIKKSFGDLQPPLSKTSSQIMSLAGALMQFNAVLSSVKRIKDVFNDEDATALEKIGALIGGLTTLVFAYNAISKVMIQVKTAETASLFGATAGWVAEKLEINLVNASLMQTITLTAIVTAGMIALIAVIYGIITVIKKIQEMSPEGQLKKLKKEQEELNEVISQANDEWTEFKENLSNYESALDGLSKLKEGTAEFNEELKKANDYAKELITKLSLNFLEDYIYDAQGAITFTTSGKQKIEQGNQRILAGQQALAWAGYEKDRQVRAQEQLVDNDKQKKARYDYVKQRFGVSYGNNTNWTSVEDNLIRYFTGQKNGKLDLDTVDVNQVAEYLKQQYSVTGKIQDDQTALNFADYILESLREQNRTSAFNSHDYDKEKQDIVEFLGAEKNPYANFIAESLFDSKEDLEQQMEEAKAKITPETVDELWNSTYGMLTDDQQKELLEKYGNDKAKALLPGVLASTYQDLAQSISNNITSEVDKFSDKNKDVLTALLLGQTQKLSPDQIKKQLSLSQKEESAFIEAYKALYGNDTEPDVNSLWETAQNSFDEIAWKKSQIQGIQAVQDKIKELNKTFASLKIGDTVDSLEGLSEASKAYFSQMEDGTYKLIGDAEQFKASLFREKVSGFENDLDYYHKTASSQVEIWDDSGDDLLGYKTRGLTKEEQEDYNNTAIAYAMTADSLQQLNQVKERFNELNVPEITQTLAINESLQDLATKYTTCTDELKDFQAALATNNQTLIDARKESLEYSIKTAELAEKMGLSVDDIEDQARAIKNETNSLDEFNLSEQDQLRVATKMAALNQSMNKGVTTLAKNWDTWKKKLTESKKTSMDYIDTIQDMKKVLKDLVGVVDEGFIPDDFFDNIQDNADLMNLMDQAAQGDAKSINLLGAALAKASVESMQFTEGMRVDNAAMLLNSGITDAVQLLDVAMSSSEEVFNYYRDNVLSGIESLTTQITNGTAQAGMDMNELLGMSAETWVASLNEMAAATGMSVDEMRSMLNALGIEAEVQTKDVDYMHHVPVYETTTEIVGYDETYHMPTKTRTSTAVVDYKDVPGKLQVAQINMGEENFGKVPQVRYAGRSAPTPSSYQTDTSGKGSGGSTKSNTKSVEEHIDEEHRYDELNKQLEGLSKQYDRLGKARDRAWGKNKIALLEQELDKLKQIQKVYERYLQTVAGDNWKNLHDTLQSGGNVGALIAAGRAGGYLQKDFDKLISAAKGGIEYKGKNENGEEQLFYIDWQGLKDTFNIDLLLNEFGDIANKDDIEEAIEAWWNSHMDDINELEDGDEKTRQKAELDAIKDYAKKALDQYADSVNTFTENSDKLLDNFYEQQDNFYKNFRYKVDLKVEISERSLKRIEYAIKILGDNIYKVPEVMQAWFDERVTNTKDEVEKMGTTWTKAYEDATAAHEQGLISDEDYIQTIKDAQDGLYGCIDSLLEINDEMREYYKNVLSKVKDEMARITDEMDHQLDTINHLTNVLSLLGRETDYAAIGKILDAQLQMSRNGYDVSKVQVEMARRQVEAAQAELEQFVMEGISEEALEEWKNAVLYPAQEALREAESEMEADFEQYLEVIKARYENNINRIYQDSERRLTGRWGSFDELNKAMERQHALDEEYLTKTNQIYETNVLLKKLAQDLDKTNNNAAKTRIKNFSSEIEELQQKNKLSKSELEIAKARYEMLLAENALEDARNAKSTVRLQRDNEGNYGYVYTADSDKITAAEDEFEQKRNDLYNLVLGQANDYTEKIIQLNQQAYSELKELDLAYAEGRIADEDTYNRLRQDIIDKYNDLIQEDYESYYRALGWLDVTASTDHTEAWGTSFADILDLEEDFKGETSQVIQETGAEISELSALRAEATEEAKVGNGELEKQLGELTKANDNLAREMIDRVVPSAEETLNMAQQLTAEWIRQYGSIMNLIGAYQSLATEMNRTMSNMSGVADEELGFDPDFDYMNAMRNWLLNGGSKEDEQYKQWSGEREAKIDYLGLSQDYYGYRGEEAQEKLDTYVANGLEGYVVADAVDSFEKAGENLEQVSEDLHQLTSYGSGGFTGNWGSRGKLAVLHEKELVLNPADTENMLSAVGMLREFSSAIDLRAAASNLSAGLNSPNYEPGAQIVEQEVNIHAEFPNVTNHSEIEEAFNSLINRASQYASRY